MGAGLEEDMEVGSEVMEVGLGVTEVEGCMGVARMVVGGMGLVSHGSPLYNRRVCWVYVLEFIRTDGHFLITSFSLFTDGQLGVWWLLPLRRKPQRPVWQPPNLVPPTPKLHRSRIRRHGIPRRSLYLARSIIRIHLRGHAFELFRHGRRSRSIRRIEDVPRSSARAVQHHAMG